VKQASSASLLGNLLRIPAAAGIVVFGLGLATDLVIALPAGAQLPPVNMGKFVHQPGDNQYSNGTQNERHAGGNVPGYQVVNPAPQQMQGPSGWSPVHKMRPDISLEPIVCDEPIAKAGFPPVPDSLDLPGVRGGGAFSAGAASARIGGYGGSAPGMGGGPAAPPEAHQGYQTYQPGAFQKGKTTGKGAEMYSSGDGAAAPKGEGGAVASPAQRQLSRMGKEPALSDKAVANVAPEAPQAMQVNQSTTQDLSLPDDQANGGRKSQSQAGRMAKNMVRQTLYRGASMIYAVPIRMP